MTGKRKSKAAAVNYNDYIRDIMRAEFEYCRNDVVYWANNYCVIEDKDSPEIIIPFRGGRRRIRRSATSIRTALT